MDISIIICTYNPREEIFKRCLTSVELLKRVSLNVEVLLVDNNSTPALTEIGYIKDFLSNCAGAKYIREEKPGLTYARVAGFNNATSPVFVLFDDDNEPDENYLVGVNDFLSRVPGVGVFGPGRITVNFIDTLIKKWPQPIRKVFQEKDMLLEQWNTVDDQYLLCYPYGTGMVIKRKVAEAYTRVVLAQHEISDRKENSLISGGDIQMVFTGLKEGYAAGRTPLLKLTHIIPVSRTEKDYLKKLSYSTSYSYIKAYLGVFPEREEEVQAGKRSFIRFCCSLGLRVVRTAFNKKNAAIQIPSFIGEIAGYYYALNEARPAWLVTAERLFKVNYYN